MRIEAFTTMTADGDRANLAITGEYVTAQDLFSVGFSFDDVRPAAFADMGQRFRALDSIDLPIRGAVKLIVDGQGTVSEVTFNLFGGVGHMALPVPLAQDLGILSAAQRLAVRGLELRGVYETAGPAVEIDRFNVDLSPNQAVYLPAPVDHSMPLAKLQGRGRYSGDIHRIDLDTLEFDLDGPIVSVKAMAEGVGKALAAKAEVTATDLKTNELSRYWPPSLAPGGYEWSIESLSDGGITDARLDVSLEEGPDGIDVETLSGTLNIQGVTVDYLPPMPKARDVAAVATIDLKSMTFRNVTGNADGVFVTGGTVTLADFDKPVETGDFDLEVQAKIPAALSLIDHPPLGYASLAGIDPAQTGGNIGGRLRMKFPLLASLTFNEVDLSGDFKLDDVSIRKIVFDRDISGGNLAIALNSKGMDVSGRLKLGNLEAGINWHEEFQAKTRISRKVTLNIDDVKTSVFQDLQVGVAPIIHDITQGPFDIDANMVTFNDGKSELRIDINADQAAVTFPFLGWSKAVGQPASGKFKLLLNGENTITDISSFDLHGPNMRIEGNARFNRKGSLESVTLNQVKGGRTEIQGTLKLVEDAGWFVDIRGNGLDLGPLISELGSGDDSNEEAQLAFENIFTKVELRTVWLSDEQSLNDVKGEARRSQDVWRNVEIDGRVGDGGQLHIGIEPGENATRNLYVHSPDAGGTLLGLGITEHMVGGTLDIRGTFDDGIAGHPLTGRLTVNNFRIKKAPAVAKLLSIMALTGILDSLRGRGIAFSILDVPFTFRDEVVELQNARASGIELGLTASGGISNGKLDLRGTVIPFNAVNSALGKIPIIGPIFSGGEKGGGLLAANYTMAGPIDDPTVTINPLSMLTPGILRNVFDLFGTPRSATGKTVPQEAAPQHP